MKHQTLRIVGALFWITATVIAVAWAGRSGSAESGVSIRQYFFGNHQQITVDDTSLRLRADDPIFLQREDGDWEQIGYVDSRVAPENSRVDIIWYSQAIAPDHARMTIYQNDGRLESVIQTMFPPDKRQAIEQRLAALMTEHGDELSAALIPLVETTLQRSIPIIEAEVQRSVQRHRDEIDRLTTRWNDQVVEEHLIPLARAEILPILREHGEPTATAIGRELWDNASLWSFGWRVAYDRSPLPQRNLAQQEWERFVEEKAIPIFENHMDEIVVSVQRIVVDVISNEAVRQELTRLFGELTADPETRKLAQTILAESLVQNDELHAVWKEVWNSEPAREAFALTSDRLEPFVRQIGDELFGSRENGINPAFAKVLRNQILGKDRRWIIASPTEHAVASQIELASETMAYPIVHLANEP